MDKSTFEKWYGWYITWEELKTCVKSGIKARFVKKTDDYIYDKCLKIGQIYELKADAGMVAVIDSCGNRMNMLYDYINKCFKRHVDIKTDKLEVGTKLKYVRKSNSNDSYLLSKEKFNNLNIDEIYEISTIDNLEDKLVISIINNKSEQVLVSIESLIRDCFEIYDGPIAVKNNITADQLKTGMYIKCIKPIREFFTNPEKIICEVGKVYKIKLVRNDIAHISHILDEEVEFIICLLSVIEENFEIYKRTIKDVKKGDIVRSLVDTKTLKKGSAHIVVGIVADENKINLSINPIFTTYIEHGNNINCFELVEEALIERVPDKKEGFLVWREGSPANSPTVIHNDMVSAEKECERLSQKFVGERFHVLKSIKSCVTKVVTCNKVKWE
jgi:hypothetical protein